MASAATAAAAAAIITNPPRSVSEALRYFETWIDRPVCEAPECDRLATCLYENHVNNRPRPRYQTGIVTCRFHRKNLVRDIRTRPMPCCFNSCYGRTCIGAQCQSTCHSMCRTEYRDGLLIVASRYCRICE